MIATRLLEEKDSAQEVKAEDHYCVSYATTHGEDMGHSFIIVSKPILDGNKTYHFVLASFGLYPEDNDICLETDVFECNPTMHYGRIRGEQYYLKDSERYVGTKTYPVAKSAVMKTLMEVQNNAIKTGEKISPKKPTEYKPATLPTDKRLNLTEDEIAIWNFFRNDLNLYWSTPNSQATLVFNGGHYNCHLFSKQIYLILAFVIFK